MPRLCKNSARPYNLKNCFGFDEDETDLSIWNNTASGLNATLGPMEFQTNKPFRLALYVRPSDRRRLNVTNNYSILNGDKSGVKRNESTVSAKTKGDRSTAKSKKTVKKGPVMLFDENVLPQNETKMRMDMTPDKVLLKNTTASSDNSSILRSVNSTRKNILTEVNSKPVTKGRQCKIRRSYERKCKADKTVENVAEKSSDEIIKEIEIKKLSRTKTKKITKEEQEFEKWASDINSDFNDVDKFELSIAYD